MSLPPAREFGLFSREKGLFVRSHRTIALETFRRSVGSFPGTHTEVQGEVARCDRRSWVSLPPLASAAVCSCLLFIPK